MRGIMRHLHILKKSILSFGMLMYTLNFMHQFILEVLLAL